MVRLVKWARWHKRHRVNIRGFGPRVLRLLRRASSPEWKHVNFLGGPERQDTCRQHERFDTGAAHHEPFLVPCKALWAHSTKVASQRIYAPLVSMAPLSDTLSVGASALDTPYS